MPKEIKLVGSAQVAICDSADYEWLNSFTWYPRIHENSTYAIAFNDELYESFYMHRLIMNPETGLVIDHFRDHNALNNSKNNLRSCTSSENSQNRSNKENNIFQIYLSACHYVADALIPNLNKLPHVIFKDGKINHEVENMQWGDFDQIKAIGHGRIFPEFKAYGQEFTQEEKIERYKKIKYETVDNPQERLNKMQQKTEKTIQRKTRTLKTKTRPTFIITDNPSDVLFTDDKMLNDIYHSPITAIDSTGLVIEQHDSLYSAFKQFEGSANDNLEQAIKVFHTLLKCSDNGTKYKDRHWAYGNSYPLHSRYTVENGILDKTKSIHSM